MEIKTQSSNRELLTGLGLTVAVWVVFRAVFFDGGCVWMSDDWYHVRYALMWDRAPANIYEARLLFNVVLRASIRALGFNAAGWALPAMCASLMVTLSAFTLAFRKVGIGGALAAGLVAATLPVDIAYATMPVAGGLSGGFFAVAMLCLLGFDGAVATAVAVVAAALGILTHSALVFHVSALAAASFLLGSRRRALVFGAGAVALFFGLECLASLLVSGDPLHNFAVLGKWHDPDAKVALYSAAWFLKPFTNLVFSKQFGLVFPVVAAGWLIPELRQSKLYRSIGLYCVVAWLWFSFGSAKPTEYEPFWRDPRFWHAMTAGLAVMVGLLGSARPKLRVPLVGGLCTLSFVLMAGSGPWGQSKDITRDMMGFIRANPNALFLTDSLTVEQATAWNEFRSLPNVCVLPCMRIGPEWQHVFVLDNVLNRPAPLPNRPAQTVTGLEKLRCGSPVLTTRQTPRLLVAWLPESVWSRYAAMVRRPAGAIRPVQEEGGTCAP